MAGRGRPSDLTPEQKQSVYTLFKDYLEARKNPQSIRDLACLESVAVFFYSYFDGVIGPTGKNLGELDWRDYLKYHFSPLVKRCSTQRVAGIQQLVADGKIPPALGIFQLKQMGWRDRQEIEHSGGVRTYIIPEQFTPEADD